MSKHAKMFPIKGNLKVGIFHQNHQVKKLISKHWIATVALFVAPHLILEMISYDAVFRGTD
jgi:hypothetical protein